jgi:hypothetical protein
VAALSRNGDDPGRGQSELGRAKSPNTSTYKKMPGESSISIYWRGSSEVQVKQGCRCQSGSPFLDLLTCRPEHDTECAAYPLRLKILCSGCTLAGDRAATADPASRRVIPAVAGADQHGA